LVWNTVVVIIVSAVSSVPFPVVSAVAMPVIPVSVRNDLPGMIIVDARAAPVIAESGWPVVISRTAPSVTVSQHHTGRDGCGIYIRGSRRHGRHFTSGESNARKNGQNA